MMSNYPPGAEYDPDAPYNEPLNDEVEVCVSQTLTKQDVIYVPPEHLHVGIYYENQHLTPMEIIQKCKKIVQQLRKEGKFMYAFVILKELEEECENWDIEQTEITEL